LSPHEHIQSQNLTRLEALSDGIFAVAMTLLVLEIHLPTNYAVHSEVELVRLLVELGPQAVTYMVSF
jgi:uncharacterized membrane protein